MRILHLLSSPVWSGPMEQVAHLALAQRELGHPAHVAIDRRRSGLSSEEPALPRLSALGLLDDSGLELCVKSSPLGVLRDLGRLRGLRVDVVHAHFSHDHLLARLSRPRGAVLVRSVHAPRSLRRGLPGADALTVPDARYVPARFKGPVEVLPAFAAPGFVPPVDRAVLRASLGLSGDPLIGMVSTFQASRRHDVALDAFALIRAECPGARLALVGDGATLEAAKAQAARLGLNDAVRFLGYQSQRAFLQHLQALDEVWILGLGNDFSGRAAAQARACGVRVVAADEGGLPLWADAVAASPAPRAVADASLNGGRREAIVLRPPDVAQRAIALYQRALEEAKT